MIITAQKTKSVCNYGPNDPPMALYSLDRVAICTCGPSAHRAAFCAQDDAMLIGSARRGGHMISFAHMHAEICILARQGTREGIRSSIARPINAARQNMQRREPPQQEVDLLSLRRSRSSAGSCPILSPQPSCSVLIVPAKSEGRCEGEISITGVKKFFHAQRNRAEMQ